MRGVFFLLIAAAPAWGAQVRIERDASGYRLLVDGKPFFIKGAVAASRFELLKQSGANAARTYAAAGQLDRIHSLGLMALAGLPLGIQRRGFDYSDPAAVGAQREKIRSLVTQFRSHPAVLMWAIGNEPEIQTTPEQRRALWREVNHLAEMIKSLDPAHPVITVVGGQYRQMLHELVEQVPAIDAIGLNAYQDMLTLPEDIARQGWRRAYVVTEFGPRGHWQAPKTPWKIPIEDTSSEKAEFYEKAYRHAVVGQPNCLGSFVFYWHQKMEKTHTWYGMFLSDGSRTEAIDVMTRLWTGAWPLNRAPRVSRVRAAPEGEPRHVYGPGAVVEFAIGASDPDGDAVDVTWDVRIDAADDPRVGGDWEPDQPPIPGAVLALEGAKARIRLPEKPGNYRVFAYARDGRGSAGTANLPVRVEP
jgi:hemoglobin-like flavoprotein